MECIFCRIVAKEIPTEVVYEDDEFLAFRDIQPQAPTHLIIIPKSHILSILELKSEQEGLIGRLILVAKELAEREGVASGFRLAVSCGEQGGQLVPHLHFHLLGGRKLSDWLG